MNWLLDHTEVLTLITIIAMPIVMFITIVLLASGKTHEAEELEGFNHERK